jgi:putative membrane protein
VETKITRGVIVIVANAIGLIAAGLLVSEFSINIGGFATAVLIFTITTVAASPLLQRAVEKGIPKLLGGIALFTTLLGLVVTNWLSDGLEVTSTAAWVMAAAIIWLVSVLISLVLPKLLLSKPTEVEKLDETIEDSEA